MAKLSKEARNILIWGIGMNGIEMSQYASSHTSGFKEIGDSELDRLACIIKSTRVKLEMLCSTDLQIDPEGRIMTDTTISTLVETLENVLADAKVVVAEYVGRGVGGREMSLTITELEYALFRAKQAQELVNE